MYKKKLSKYLVWAIIIYTGLLLSCPNPNGLETNKPEKGKISETYLVSYKSNGATGVGPSDQKKVKGESLKLADSSEGFVNPGKIIKEWNTKADGTGIGYKLGESYTTESDITLYAMWYIPIKIADDFDQMRANLDEAFVLQNDIDLSSNFQSIGTENEPFTGILDGQNHKINNLKLVQPNAKTLGFFTHLKGANIHDLQFTNSQIEALGSKMDDTKIDPYTVGVAVLAGYAQGSGSIERVIVSQQAKIKATEGYAGGLIGKIEAEADNQFIIKDCKVDGTVVEGALNIGGLVGYGENIQVQGCEVSIEVKGNSKTIGGLIGRQKGGSIIESHNTAMVSGTKIVGGLVGSFSGNIENSYVTGMVTSIGTGDDNHTIGGLVGIQESGNIIECYGTSEVSGNKVIGGLVAQQKEGIIRKSYATGKVTGAFDVGGLVGYQNEKGSIVESYATGEVLGSEYVGGLLGRQVGSVSKSYSSSKVTATQDTVGGLIGFHYADSSTVQCFATGEVSGVSDVGGLVGYQGASIISQCYATGKVTGTMEFTGGLIGKQGTNSKVSESYATGEVLGVSGVGGFIGRKYGQSSNDYFASDSSKTTKGVGIGGDSSGITAYTSADLTGMDKFTNWNFIDVWYWLGSSKWPQLRWKQEVGVNP